MKFAGTWSRRIFAVTLGMAVVGGPLFTVHADEGSFDRHGEHRYDVRRGAYEQEGGSDTSVKPGKYADEEKAREQREEHKDKHDDAESEKARRERQERREEHERERREEIEKEEGSDKPREYKYDVRRGMYEQEGGSDTEVSRGMYEQPEKDGEHRGLSR